MGGKLDATNVVNSLVSVITNVSLEHTEILGGTVLEIAEKKAGIIKEGVPLVTAVRQPAALAVIKARCLETGAPCYRVGKQIKVRFLGERRFAYRGLGWRFDHLHSPLAGRHQIINAATALGALEALERQGHVRLEAAYVGEGLRQTRWSGRLEWLRRQPPVLLDGAHNYAGMTALSRALVEEYGYRRLIVVLGVMADKDLRGMLLKLAPLADHLILTRPRYERAAEPESILEMAGDFSGRIELIRPVEAAIERAVALATSEDLVLVTGSLYFIGEVKEIEERRTSAIYNRQSTT
jgi:dihydrofolate synthase/folylpolyglutamate synthase